MGMGLGLLVKVVVVVVVGLVLPAAYAVQYTVGDSSGWTSGADYTTWPSGKTFTVGDTLLFNYGGSHSVDVVSESDYKSCSSSNALQSFSDGKTSIPLASVGTVYFICPTAGHCDGGMKLSVTVVAASSGGGSTPSTPSTPSTNGTTTTPSATTPSTDTSAAARFGNVMIGSSLALLAAALGMIMA